MTSMPPDKKYRPVKIPRSDLATDLAAVAAEKAEALRLLAELEARAFAAEKSAQPGGWRHDTAAWVASRQGTHRRNIDCIEPIDRTD